MLIQQRQRGKHGWPNLWDVTVGGAAVTGDSSCSAAQRELFEELGLELDLCGMRPHLTVNFDGGFDDFYLINKEVDLKTLRLQKEEVQGVRWATQNDICEMIDQGVFIPYFKNLIGLLFEMKDGYGSHSK
jgi:isopentenyldiphosphate isomerase